jgi:signal transduction histidine kinase
MQLEMLLKPWPAQEHTEAATTRGDMSEDTASGIRITVADSGCGISSDVLTHLFEPFYTTRGSTRAGLGL